MDPISNRPRRWISGIEPAPELLSANGTEMLEIECREQPQRLRELISAYSKDPAIRSVLHSLRSTVGSNDGPIILLGMGASLCSSISGAVFLQNHGRSAFSIDAGEWLHYARPAWKNPALSILLTTSGESAELVELFRQENDSELALICNNPGSTSWGLTENHLPILAGPEYGNATKTYTNSTAATIISLSELIGVPWEEDANAASAVFSANLERIFELRSKLEEFCRDATNIEVIGRGAAYGGAEMSALCIREMTGHRAAAHTGAGFRHGPNLDVDASHLAIIFALGRTANLSVKLAQECVKRGGKVLLVSEENREPTESLLPVRLDPVPEPWEGITSLLVPQALTLAMVERTGSRLPPRFEYGVMEE